MQKHRHIKWPTAFMMVLMAGLLSGCALLSGVMPLPLHVSKSKPFIIAKTDNADGWGVAAHPVLWRMSNERIMLTYNVLGDIGDGYSGVARLDWPAYTEDGGKTWQFGDPIQWLEEPPLHDTFVRVGHKINKWHYGYCFGAVIMTNGISHSMGRCFYITKDEGTWNTRVWSEDGLNWHGPKKVYCTGLTNAFQYVEISPAGVQLPDGSLLCVGYSMNGPIGKGKAFSLILRSIDEGRSYEYLSTIATKADVPWGTTPPCEPGLLLTPDHTLLCLMRTGGSGLHSMNSPHMLLSVSKDFGKTWKHGWFKWPGVMPGLVQLKNGTIVCDFGRPGNNLGFSVDNGRSWGHEVTINPPDIYSTGYVDMMEVSPNRLLVVYDAYDTPAANLWLWDPPEPVNAIWGVFLDVKRLF